VTYLTSTKFVERIWEYPLLYNTDKWRNFSMIGLGTIVNVIAVLAGAAIGMIIKGGLPQRFEKTILGAIGLATFFIGITGALSGMLVINENHGVSSQYTMLMIISLVVGAFLGELINIEKRLDTFGEWCKKRFKFKGNKAVPASNDTFVEGFVSSALLFCVGAMSIVGSLEDGLSANATTLYAKSILDGVAAMIFSASLGVGVFFSVIPLAIYQGGITLMAKFIKPYLSDVIIGQMSFVGSILIFAIGFNLIFGKKIKVGNMLPAMFMPILIDGIVQFVKKWLTLM